MQSSVRPIAERTCTGELTAYGQAVERAVRYRDRALKAEAELARLKASENERLHAATVIFSDTADDIEERMAYDAIHVCPYCGGSGHADDIQPSEKRDGDSGRVED